MGDRLAWKSTSLTSALASLGTTSSHHMVFDGVQKAALCNTKEATENGEKKKRLDERINDNMLIQAWTNTTYPNHGYYRSPATKGGGVTSILVLELVRELFLVSLAKKAGEDPWHQGIRAEKGDDDD